MNVQLTNIYWTDDSERTEETLTVTVPDRPGQTTTPEDLKKLIREQLPELDSFSYSVDYHCSRVTELMELVGVTELLKQGREDDAADLLIQWMDHEEFFRYPTCARYEMLDDIVVEFRHLDPSKNCRTLSRLVNVLACVDQIAEKLVHKTLIQLDVFSRAYTESTYAMDPNSETFELANVKAMELTVTGMDHSDYQFCKECSADIIRWVEEHPMFVGTQFDGMDKFPSSRTWIESDRDSVWMTWYAEEPETDED